MRYNINQLSKTYYQKGWIVLKEYLKPSDVDNLIKDTEDTEQSRSLLPFSTQTPSTGNLLRDGRGQFIGYWALVGFFRDGTVSRHARRVEGLVLFARRDS